MYCLWLLLSYHVRVELLQQRAYVAHKAKNIYYVALYRKNLLTSSLVKTLNVMSIDASVTLP